MIGETNYETVIGLEVHAELATKSKIYCGCSTAFNAEANTQTCEICTGMPGVLPVLNKSVVDYAIKAGLAVNCSITAENKQDRKNYFYPDLPKAYQISQYDLPICVKGYLDINVQTESQGNPLKRVGITRIHIEEDAGKLIHGAGNETLVDYNRCGVPLIEIVTEPDIRSAEEAKAFLEKLKSILEYTTVSDCKMQEGSLRCDVNISVRPVGQKELGTRVEIKNLNSFSAAFRAIEYEAQRQIEVLTKGGRGVITQETRRWDDDNYKSFSMRGKEQAHDYRYFPEPDLAAIIIDDKWIEAIKSELPELPDAKIKKYTNDYGLPQSSAQQIAGAKSLAQFFESILEKNVNAKNAANWLLGDISKIMNEKNIEADKIPFNGGHIADMLNLIESGAVSNTAGKKIIEELFENPRNVADIVKEKNLSQISDRQALREIVREVIAKNPKIVMAYKAGQNKVLGFLTGESMKLSKGQGNPKLINELLLEDIWKNLP